MPSYNSICDNCGAVHEYIRRIAFCMDTPSCCGAPTRKIILHAPVGVVFGRFDPFKSPVDGSLIRSPRELSEHNKRNGVVSLADGYSEERLIKGDYGGVPKVDKRDIKHDVSLAVQMVNNGYKPEVGVQEDD